MASNAVNNANVIAALKEVKVSDAELKLFPSSASAQVEYLQRLQEIHPEHKAVLGILIGDLQRGIAEAKQAAAPKPQPVQQWKQDFEMRGYSAAVVGGHYSGAIDAAQTVIREAESRGLPFSYETLKEPGGGFTSAKIRVTGPRELLDRFVNLARAHIA